MKLEVGKYYKFKRWYMHYVGGTNLPAVIKEEDIILINAGTEVFVAHVCESSILKNIIEITLIETKTGIVHRGYFSKDPGDYLEPVV